VDDANHAVGEAIGKHYVEKHFDATKERADEMTKNIIAAFAKRIDALVWMSPQTKASAKAKLSELTVGMGYPLNGATTPALRSAVMTRWAMRSAPSCSGTSATSPTWPITEIDSLQLTNIGPSIAGDAQPTARGDTVADGNRHGANLAGNGLSHRAPAMGEGEGEGDAGAVAGLGGRHGDIGQRRLQFYTLYALDMQGDKPARPGHIPTDAVGVIHIGLQTPPGFACTTSASAPAKM